MINVRICCQYFKAFKYVGLVIEIITLNYLECDTKMKDMKESTRYIDNGKR